MARQIDQAASEIQTTNATQSTLVSLTLPEGSSSHVVAEVLAQLANGDTAVLELHVGAKRVGAGNAALLDVVSVPLFHKDVALALVQATIDASGSDLRLRVTGLAGTTIDWAGRMEVFSRIP